MHQKKHYDIQETNEHYQNNKTNKLWIELKRLSTTIFREIFWSKAVQIKRNDIITQCSIVYIMFLISTLRSDTWFSICNWLRFRANSRHYSTNFQFQWKLLDRKCLNWMIQLEKSNFNSQWKLNDSCNEQLFSNVVFFSLSVCYFCCCLNWCSIQAGKNWKATKI